MSRQEDAPSAAETTRQRIVEILRRDELGFEQLQREVGIQARALEEDLRHIERSLRRGPERLRIQPASCLSCGFIFRERTSRHLHAPGRCPQCRGDRIADPRFRID